MFDAKKVTDEAQKEFEEEFLEEAKKRIKAKLSAIKKAETVVQNLKREYEDLVDAISQGN